MTIKSVYYDQRDIISGIMELCGIDRFDCDISYGNGSFYKDIKPPLFGFDVDLQVLSEKKNKTTTKLMAASSENLPLKDSSVDSVMFDPPFLTYIKKAREHNSIMAGRFGGYWSYNDLSTHYKSTISEVHRVLCKKGIFVFKCQDIIHNHRLHSTHINIVEWCKDLFRLKDMFVLPAKHRMPMPNKKAKQKHARIYHSYFLVLERL